ncbi:MAG: Dyp-type peroxidase [Corynebacterium sp.]|nr:Dyp-type peroxidase [Corynebacterium sp.]
MNTHTSPTPHGDKSVDSETSNPTHSTVSRRGFILGAAAAASASGLVACGHATENPEADPETSAFLATDMVPFDGLHQAGIETPGQAHINVIAFTMRAGTNKNDARRLMTVWTEDARRLTKGENPLGSLEPELTTIPANLTFTCGFGARFFDIIGEPDKRPEWLKPIPVFSKDKLEDAWGEADIVLQICCDDPLTLAFATRHMTRAGAQIVETRWMQQGFLNARGATKPGTTPRNLFGQKDGTVNPESDADYDSYVWIGKESGDPEWVHGGTSMIVRRISMNLDTWEELDRTSREVAMGRFLESGAPLTGTHEFDKADFKAKDEFGLPVIDPRSHIALAAPPADDSKEKMRRRAYNYLESHIPGSDHTTNVGLVFVCFQQNPVTQFVPVQQRLNDNDRMNTWITHIGSAVFVVPPGTDENGSGRDQYWGATLLES